MRVVVPVAAERPKTRLADVLNGEERVAFAMAMLEDVLRAVREAGSDPEVLATAPVEVDAPVTVDERPLTTAVNAALGEDVPIAVVMADLPLATPGALEELFEMPGDVAIAPGRGGGTNALVVRHSDFRVDYHGGSFLKHRDSAAGLGSFGIVDSHRLATDIDERSDLVELLIHGEGTAVDWLRDAGFSLVLRESRLAVTRA
ncbi:2-phospho-L-lactate guanylyltransferase [Halalkalicoccus salilacus]|uniref:2-phospho-L-lactate guanylyltransferase n=1 Tax=Halalkalicoccus salilacus TaxID=3117459 RepID=UPI00300EE716